MQHQAIRNTGDLKLILGHSAPVRGTHLGELLVRDGVLSEEQLKLALAEQQRHPSKHLGHLLVEMKFATRAQVNAALADKFRIPVVNLASIDIDPAAVALLPPELALGHSILPLYETHGRLVVATDNPLDQDGLEAVRFATQRSIDPVLCSPEELTTALDHHYNHLDEGDALEQLKLGPAANVPEPPRSVHLIEQEAQLRPVVRLLNSILLQAVMANASDVNIRPEKEHVAVYYRTDGKLRFMRRVSPALLPALVARIKVIARMDVAEHRLPQDGHARLQHGDRQVDLRISVVPTDKGESVVVRILDRAVALRPFSQLGFPDAEMDCLRRLLSHPSGMLLVTGPTGSGKSTTLYAILHEMKRANPHIITVEDPVEYDIDGVEQINIASDRGYTFAEALRHILRHDPDVIMIGEMRDVETTRIAIKAALTGHQVLSTLHTNDAVGTVNRLLDMGVEPYLLGTTLNGVVAQRLVRLICPHCRQPEAADSPLRAQLGVGPDEAFQRGAGCVECNYTGYHGRRAVCELLTVTPAVRRLVNRNASADEIRAAAIAAGMVPLQENALKLARAGVTTLEEVLSTRLD